MLTRLTKIVQNSRAMEMSSRRHGWKSYWITIYRTVQGARLAMCCFSGEERRASEWLRLNAWAMFQMEVKGSRSQPFDERKRLLR